MFTQRLENKKLVCFRYELSIKFSNDLIKYNISTHINFKPWLLFSMQLRCFYFGFSAQMLLGEANAVC